MPPEHLAAACELDLDVLKARYESERRSVVIGPVDRHDRTLQLWIDAIDEERKAAADLRAKRGREARTLRFMPPRGGGHHAVARSQARGPM